MSQALGTRLSHCAVTAAPQTVPQGWHRWLLQAPERPQGRDEGLRSGLDSVTLVGPSSSRIPHNFRICGSHIPSAHGRRDGWVLQGMGRTGDVLVVPQPQILLHQGWA